MSGKIFCLCHAVCVAVVSLLLVSSATADQGDFLIGHYSGDYGGYGVNMWDSDLGTITGVVLESDHDRVDGMAVGPDGNLYITSLHTDEIHRFNRQTGEFMDVFVPDNYGIWQPTNILFGPDGYMYVSECNDYIHRFDAQTGAYIDRSPYLGGEDHGPRGMVFGPDGMLYVAMIHGAINEAKGRVERLDPTNWDRDIFVEEGTLHGASGLAFSPDGNKLFVSDFYEDKIFTFDGATGDYESLLAEYGAGMPLGGPSDMLFTESGDLLVACAWDGVSLLDAETGVLEEVVLDSWGTVALAYDVPEPATLSLLALGGLALLRRRRRFPFGARGSRLPDSRLSCRFRQDVRGATGDPRQ